MGGGVDPFKNQEVPVPFTPPDILGPLPPDAKEEPKIKKEGPQVEKEKQNLDEDIEKNPELKKLFKKTIQSLNDQPPETQFSMNRIIVLLIGLCRALQDASVVMANRLEKVTERLTGYSKLITQVPVVTDESIIFSNEGADDKEKRKSNADKRGINNQKFANMLEAIRANKGLDEDKAKKIQTLLQSVKDTNASSADFCTSFIDLLRGMNSKLFR